MYSCSYQINVTALLLKQYCRLLAKAHLIEDSTPHAHDPYSDNNKAPFYRQPAGLRRIRKIEEKEDASMLYFNVIS